MRCMGNDIFRGGGTHLRHIQDQSVLPRIAPVRAKQRHQPARPRLLDMIDIAARRLRLEPLSLTHLLDAILHGRREQHSQNVTDAWEQPMPDMSHVDKILRKRGLADGRLQRDPVRSQILMPTFPPVWRLFDDVVKLRRGYVTTLARGNEDFAADELTTHLRRDVPSQFLIIAKSSTKNCYDWHGPVLLPCFS